MFWLMEIFHVWKLFIIWTKYLSFGLDYFTHLTHLTYLMEMCKHWRIGWYTFWK